MHKALPPAGSLIGVVHLLPLPGAPSGVEAPQEPGVASRVLERALQDADILVTAGFSALIIENLGDAPFSPGSVEPHVVAHMTAVAAAVGARLPTSVGLGINVLRNDALSALAVASAVGAAFVRVNVHVGAMVCDQGILQGQARETLLYRRRLGLECAIAADVLVKHAVPLGESDPGRVAHDTFHRGLADALIVTGSATGAEASPDRIRRVRDAVPEAPLWLGSGLTPANAATFRSLCDGAIVGTWLHRDGCLDAPLDLERARAVVGSWRG